MNRPIIKGTASHKASIAKAKEESVVTPYSPHAADVLSGVDTYSRSFVPGAIDYTLENPELDLKKKKKKKKKDDKKVVGCMDSSATNYNSAATEPCDNCCEFKEKENEKEKEKEYPESYTEEDIKFLEEQNEDVVREEEKKEGIGTRVKKSIKDTIKNIRESIEEKQRKNREEWEKEQEEKRRIQAEKEIIPIEPKEVSQIPTDVSEPEIEKAIEIPQTSKTVDADKNPNYRIGGRGSNIEGGRTSLGGVVENPGYNYDATNDAWTYNGIPIRESEVSSEAYEGIMNMVMRDDASTSSSSSSTNTLMRETTPSNELLNKLKGGQKRRLDKLWANSTPGGTVRENMLKDGYVPPTE